MPTRVLVSVITKDKRLLICQRPMHKRHGALWEFPGGKVKDGESDFEAAYRELREELAVDVTGVGPVAFSVRDPGSDFVIEFLPVEIEGEPNCLEHLHLEWMKEEDLLSQAGFEPRTRFLRGDAKFPPRSKKLRARWEHRCPVCHAIRVAGSGRKNTGSGGPAE